MITRSFAVIQKFFEIRIYSIYFAHDAISWKLVFNCFLQLFSNFLKMLHNKNHKCSWVDEFLLNFLLLVFASGQHQNLMMLPIALLLQKNCTFSSIATSLSTTIMTQLQLVDDLLVKIVYEFVPPCKLAMCRCMLICTLVSKFEAINDLLCFFWCIIVQHKFFMAMMNLQSIFTLLIVYHFSFELASLSLCKKQFVTHGNLHFYQILTFVPYFIIKLSCIDEHVVNRMLLRMYTSTND